MKKMILIAIAVTFLMVTGAYATPTLDYYTGNSSDSIYSDTGAPFVTLTDPTDPASTPTMFALNTITSTYQHDFSIGIFDVDSSDNVVHTLSVLDTYLDITSDNVIFDVAAGTARTVVGGIQASMATTFGYYLAFYTDDFSGIMSNEIYYSHDSSDLMGVFYDQNGLSSLNWAETAISFGDASSSGVALIGVADVAPVPEPATLLLLGSGLVGLAFLKRRKS